MVKSMLHAEGAIVLATSLYILYGTLHVPWWVLPIVLVGPDVAMIGYAFNPRVGATLYNIVHTYSLSLSLVLLGWIADIRLPLVAGLVLAAHIGMDRALGYGLKYPTAFKDTHLGRV